MNKKQHGLKGQKKNNPNPKPYKYGEPTMAKNIKFPISLIEKIMESNLNFSEYIVNKIRKGVEL